MELVGYGVRVKGKPHGIWPVPLSRAQDRVRYAMEQGLSNVKIAKEDLSIVPVYVGNPVEIAPAAPVFPERAEA
jgi:hypothetical protein